MMRPINLHSAVLLIALAAMATGCSKPKGGSTTPTPVARLPTDATLNTIPLGAPPGQPVSIAARIRNPFEGNAIAAQQGKRLFSQMNCVYCHGAGASGLIGPSLNAPGWRYGGTPAEIYRSIHDGRPQGMPAWSGRLPPDQIWKIVAYIESLGGAEPPATGAMTGIAGEEPSATGPEPADQSQTDTAHQALLAAQRKPGQ